MTVYIEDSVIENFFVTLLILLCLNKIFKSKRQKKCLFFASLFGGVIATFYPLFNFNGLLLTIFRLCAGVIIVYIYDGKNKLLAKYIAFMLLTALYAGINILVYYLVYGTLNISDNFATHILIVMLFVIYYLVNSSIKLLKKNLTITNFVYNVKIVNNNCEFMDSAFLDSGNTLIDKIDGTPIFVVNYKLFSRIFKDITIEDILSKNYKDLKNPHYVKSNFASGASKILVFNVDEINIFNRDKQIVIKNAKLGLVYAKFDKNFGCNMLLNINAFIGA